MNVRRLLSVSCLIVVCGGVHAASGALEINQACAKNTGCFPGDSAGFPVTLTSPGSYQLVGNLDLTAESPNTSAIDVLANDVDIDLNGFLIQGPCAGAAPCSPTGNGLGINASNDLRIRVRGGKISGMGLDGIFIGNYGQVEDVYLKGNGRFGIITGGWTMIRRCTADGNSGEGVTVTTGSQVVDSIAFDNLGTGFEARGPGVQFVGNTSDRNDIGFQSVAGPQAAHRFQRNVARDNTNVGIGAGDQSILVENLAVGNGSIGIAPGNNSLAMGNLATDNAQGISAGSETTMGLNAAKLNSSSNITGAYDPVACNYSGSTQTCP